MTRYAVYLAPPADGALWHRASAWLGRDAAANAEVPFPDVPGYDAGQLAALTAEPRRYGFHATVTAPFRLVEGTALEDLCEEADAFARARAPFALPLKVSLLSAFAALTPVEPVAEVAALHADALAAFDRFREPLGEADRARRLLAPLSDVQKAHLERWGYPYVLDQFRLHFTLTGALAPEDRVAVAALLADHFADVVAEPLLVDAICLFEQPAPGAPFRIVHRAAFSVA